MRFMCYNFQKQCWNVLTYQFDVDKDFFEKMMKFNYHLVRLLQLWVLMYLLMRFILKR
jgi:hypothetical protein